MTQPISFRSLRQQVWYGFASQYIAQGALPAQVDENASFLTDAFFEENVAPGDDDEEDDDYFEGDPDDLDDPVDCGAGSHPRIEVKDTDKKEGGK